MEPSIPYRPRVSRETRLLLTAGLLALAVLWLLSRIRFQERPLTPNPVPAVLSQLSRVPAYDDLAAEVAQLQSRVGPYLFTLDLRSGPAHLLESSRRVGALRLREDLAVAWVPGGSDSVPEDDMRVLAGDRVSSSCAPPANSWNPRRTPACRAAFKARAIFSLERCLQRRCCCVRSSSALWTPSTVRRGRNRSGLCPLVLI